MPTPIVSSHGAYMTPSQSDLGVNTSITLVGTGTLLLVVDQRTQDPGFSMQAPQLDGVAMTLISTNGRQTRYIALTTAGASTLRTQVAPGGYDFHQVAWRTWQDTVGSGARYGAPQTASGNSASPSSGSVTLAAGQALDAAFFHDYSTAQPTASSGAQNSGARDAGTGHSWASGFRDTTGAVTWTADTAANWSAIHMTVIGEVSAPSFTTHPQSQTRTVGQGVTFSFAATGHTSQQWQVNDGTGWADISGATSASFTISAVQLADNGLQFRVQITGPGGGPVSSNAATLTVNPAAATGVTFTGPTSGTVGQASSNFSIGVTPTGGSIAGTLVVTLTDNGGGGTWTPATVSLTNAQPTATATYTPGSAGVKTLGCTNNGGLTNPSTISYTASISGVAPQVTQHPAAVNVVAGTNGQMTAAFSGTPTPTVQWQRSAAGGGAWANISGATNLTLSLSPTTVTGGSFNNGDQFRCVATNASGSATTNPATLTVTAPPTGGTLTSTVLRRLNKTIHANKPFTAQVRTLAGVGVVNKTGLTSSSLGICAFQDAALTQGQQVEVTWVRTDTGERGVEVLTVS
jgi:hypothetical protein